MANSDGNMVSISLDTDHSFRQRLAFYLDLGRALVVRDFRGRYRRSLLGIWWVFLQPIFYLVVFNVIKGAFEVRTNGVPYVIFAYSALVPWSFFSATVTAGASSVRQNSEILMKMAVSKELFPLVGLVGALINFVVAALILVPVMIWYDAPIGWALLWLLPLTLLLGWLAFIVAMAFASIGTYKDDIRFALPYIMQAGLLASPIIYGTLVVPEKWRVLYQLNPLVGIIEGYRSVLTQGVAPDGHMLLISVVVTAVISCVVWPVFRRMSRYFTDYM